MYTRVESHVVDGKWATRSAAPVKVRVMARAEGYAMVRYTGCTPFVVAEGNLSEIPHTAGGEPK